MTEHSACTRDGRCYLRISLACLVTFVAGHTHCHGEDSHVDQLIAERAQDSLTAGPFSVMQKTGVAPSGDRHDFLTLPPYLWPNPGKPDGIPYVRRDGRLNPEAASDRFDRVAYFEMSKHAQLLSLAWHHTGKEQFADRAALLIRTWFLNPESRMNPHFQYAQLPPGKDAGLQYGIIRGMSILELHACLAWLRTSSSWTQDDEAAWKTWIAQYLDWLHTSELGQRESRSRNNHGTWYDLQIVTFSRYVGDQETATYVLKNALEDRIGRQIEESGRQPRETGRTKSWSYSVMNLRGLLLLAEQGDAVGVDLYSDQASGGGSIRSAMDYLIPFARGEQSWPHRNIEAWEPELLVPLLPLAASAWNDPTYLDTADQLDPHGIRRSTSVLGHSW